jgi:hypothetical protein
MSPLIQSRVAARGWKTVAARGRPARQTPDPAEGPLPPWHHIRSPVTERGRGTGLVVRSVDRHILSDMTKRCVDPRLAASARRSANRYFAEP